MTFDREDLKDLSLLNEAIEDAMIVLDRLENKHGRQLDALSEITSRQGVELWRTQLRNADRLGRALYKAAAAYMRHNENGPH